MSTDSNFPILSPIADRVIRTAIASWMEDANSLAYSFQRILALPSEKFWPSVTHGNFLEAFDSAADALPRKWNHDQYALLFFWDEAWFQSVSNLRTTLLATYLRIGVWSKKVEPSLSEKDWNRQLSDQNILPIERAIAVWSHFPHEFMLFSKILKTTNGSAKSAEEFVKKIAKELTDLRPYSDQLLSSFRSNSSYRRMGFAEMIKKWLELTVDILQQVSLALRIFSSAGISPDLMVLLSCVCKTVEEVTSSFGLETLLDVAAAIPQYPIRSLLRSLTEIESTTSKLIVLILEVLPISKRTSAIEILLKHDRVTFIVNERKLISSYFDRLSPPTQQKIERICSNQLRNTQQKVERQGLFKNLANFSCYSETLQLAIVQLQEVFPHLSPAYLHLALRNFGGDVAQTIDALVQKDSRIPKDFLRLEMSQLSESGLPQDYPKLNFKCDDALKSSIKKSSAKSESIKHEPGKKSSEEKNVFKGLFSLVPSANSQNLEQQKPSSSTESDVQKITDVVRIALEQLSIREDSILRQEHPIPSNEEERLVPMPTAKKYAGISKFKQTDAQKIALRPTYEAYKFETPEDDMYDDEYDDGYEQKEFQVEPLNGHGSSDESGEETEETPAQMPVEPVSGRGNRGNQRGRGNFQQSRGRGDGRGGHVEGPAAVGENQGGAQRPSKDGYTGGRDRQMKERHKNTFKQRGADRKMRNAQM